MVFVGVVFLVLVLVAFHTAVPPPVPSPQQFPLVFLQLNHLQGFVGVKTFAADAQIQRGVGVRGQIKPTPHHRQGKDDKGHVREHLFGRGPIPKRRAGGAFTQGIAEISGQTLATFGTPVPTPAVSHTLPGGGGVPHRPVPGQIGREQPFGAHGRVVGVFVLKVAIPTGGQPDGFV